MIALLFVIDIRALLVFMLGEFWYFLSEHIKTYLH